jgi:uncharacterized protein GlcG (DUF336 family)
MANVSRAAVRGVDLATAEKIIDYALTVARQNKLRPMTIAVLDSGGDLIAFKREDGTGIRRFDVVMGKAIGKIGENAPLFIQSLTVATQGRLIPTPGGVLIKNAEGEIIGAVGSSGDEADDDEAIAIAAVRHAGLFPEPAEPVV